MARNPFGLLTVKEGRPCCPCSCSLKNLFRLPKTKRGWIIFSVVLVLFIFCVNAITVGILLCQLQDSDMSFKLKSLELVKLTDFYEEGALFKVKLTLDNPVPLGFSVSVSSLSLYNDDTREEYSEPMVKLANPISDLKFHPFKKSDFEIEATVLLDPEQSHDIMDMIEGERPTFTVEASASLYTLAFWFPLTISKDIVKKIRPSKKESFKMGSFFNVNVKSVVGVEDIPSSDLMVDLSVQIEPAEESEIEILWTLDPITVAVTDENKLRLGVVRIEGHSIATDNVIKLSLMTEKSFLPHLTRKLEKFASKSIMPLSILFLKVKDAPKWTRQVKRISFKFDPNCLDHFFPKLDRPAPFGSERDIYDIAFRDVHMRDSSFVVTFKASLDIANFIKGNPKFRAADVVKGRFIRLEADGFLEKSGKNPVISLIIISSKDSWIDLHGKPFEFSCEVVVHDFTSLFDLVMNAKLDEVYFQGSTTSGHFLSSLLSAFKYKVPAFLSPSIKSKVDVFEFLKRNGVLLPFVERSNSTFNPNSKALVLSHSAALFNLTDGIVMSEANFLSTIENNFFKFGKFSWLDFSIAVDLNPWSIPAEVKLRLAKGSAYCIRPIHNYEELKGRGCSFKSNLFQLRFEVNWLRIVKDLDLNDIAHAFSSGGKAILKVFFDLEFNSLRKRLQLPEKYQEMASGKSFGDDLKHIIASPVGDFFEELKVNIAKTRNEASVDYSQNADKLLNSVKELLRAIIYPNKSERVALIHDLISSLPLEMVAVLESENFWKQVKSVLDLPNFSRVAVDRVISDASVTFKKLFDEDFSLLCGIVLEAFKTEKVKFHDGSLAVGKHLASKSFFEPILKALINYVMKALAEYKVTKLVDLGTFFDPKNVNLKEMPETYSPIFVEFFQRYFDEVGPVIKADMIANFLDLNSTASTEKTIAKMIHHSGPFLQKTFQLFHGNLMDKSLRNLLSELRNNIEPMSDRVLKAQLELGFGTIEEFNRTFPLFDWNSVNAASIAQGHKGKMLVRNGKGEEVLEAVFIKIKRPNLSEKLKEETRLLVEIADKHNQGVMFRKIAESYDMELDFELEVSNGILSSSYFPLDHDAVRTAHYIGPLHNQENKANIGLVMGIAPGEPVTSFISRMSHDAKAGCVLQNVLIKALESWFKTSLYGVSDARPGFFHGDPHGGNLMFSYNETYPEESFITMIDMGNAHTVTKTLARSFIYVGSGIKLSKPYIVFYGLELEYPSDEQVASLSNSTANCKCTSDLSKPCSDCLLHDRVKLRLALETLFASRDFLCGNMEYKFDSAVKTIGNFGRLPYPEKAIEFFRAKTHLEKLIHEVRDRFGDAALTRAKCKKPDLPFLYTEWGMSLQGLSSLNVFETLSVIGITPIIKVGTSHLCQKFFWT